MITQILTNLNQALSAPGVSPLGDCYKQLNSSVGEFGTATLRAATTPIDRNTPGDQAHLNTDLALSALEMSRDGLAGHIKAALNAAAFSNAQCTGRAGC